MKRIISLIAIATLMFFATSCRDATSAQIRSLGSKHIITMYGTNGIIIKQWESTGNVRNQQGSDGYYFEDSQTYKLVEVSGNITIEQE